MAVFGRPNRLEGRYRMAAKIAYVLLSAALAGALSACADEPTTTGSATAVGSGAAADFGLPADAGKAAVAAGLPMLGEEKLAVHYHAHLDLSLRGSVVAVPAGIGIDTKNNKISPLHTHEPDGVVHIESATDVPFTLGQFFTEWGHPISAQQIGSVTAAAGEQIRVYRNGTLVEGDPAAMTFKPHDEVYVWLGRANEQPQVPGAYNFPAGE
jgi:hypothetical protein